MAFYVHTGHFIHNYLVTAFQPDTSVTLKPPRQALMPETGTLASSTDKTCFTATVSSTGLDLHKEPVTLEGGAL